MPTSELTRLLASIFNKRSRVSRTEHRGVATVTSTRERLHWTVEASFSDPSTASIYYSAIEDIRPDRITRWNNGDVW